MKNQIFAVFAVVFTCCGSHGGVVPKQCSIADYGGVADNQTDNTHAFRRITADTDCTEVIVPPGVWMTGPFNLTSNTVLHIQGEISGSLNPDVYPIVTQQPVDEAYRAPYMHNRQYQALISAYSAQNITINGGGTINGNGWTWWYNFTTNATNTYEQQRPKLVEFVDCEDLTVTNLTLMNSPFWTFHPIFCKGVTASHLTVLAPRDHGNTDGIDPDSCSNVYVHDCLIDVGDDAVSVKSGVHWKTHEKVPAENHLFERVEIKYRNFALGSAVSGDIRNITMRDSIIGDDLGSSPWAIKLKTDSQEGGLVDGVYFKNIRIGNITYCGSSKFVFTPPHSRKNMCEPKQVGATMIYMGMGYGGLKPTNPGRLTNVVFDGIYGIGPTGALMSASGLAGPIPGWPVGQSPHIVNVTVFNVSLQTGGEWQCNNVDGFTSKNVMPWPSGSKC